MESFLEQFLRLDEITVEASTFLFNDGWQYTGPVRPVGIIRQNSTDSRPIPKRSDQGRFQNYLVIAEHVSLDFTMGDDVAGDEPYPTGIVLSPLTDNYDFLDWVPHTRTLASLQAIHWCSDGSMETACAESSGRFLWEVLLRVRR
jgi:hypothetical protein